MAHDAPPKRVLDLPLRNSPATRPRLVPLLAPRVQSTTMTINIRTLAVALALPVFALALTDNTLRSEVTAHVVRWVTASLLLLCALSMTIITERPIEEHHRYRLGILLLVALSLFEAAPRGALPAVATVLVSLHDHAVLTILGGACIAAATFALELRHNGTITVAPALLLYMGGVMVCTVIGDHDYEHPTTELIRSIATLCRMLGPVLALRAMLRYLSPPTQPSAVRFLIVPRNNP